MHQHWESEVDKKESDDPPTVFLGIRAFAERSGLPMSVVKRLITEKKLDMRIVGRKYVIASSELGRLENIVERNA